MSIAWAGMRSRGSECRVGMAWLLIVVGIGACRDPVQALPRLDLRILGNPAVAVASERSFVASVVGDSVLVTSADFEVDWSVQPSGPAVLVGFGRVRGVARGHTYLVGRARLGGIDSALVDSVRLTVVAAGVQVDVQSLLLDALGLDTLLVARAVDANGQFLDAVPVWSSSLPGVVSMTPDGWLSTNANGEADVTAGVDDRTAGIRVVVRQVPATIAIAPDSARLTIGDTMALSVRLSDRLLRGVEGAFSPSWRTTNPLVARVIDAHGVIRAVGRGGALVIGTVSGPVGLRSDTVVVLVSP